MDRDRMHAHRQDLSGRIKRRWGRLSDEEIARAHGDRQYLADKVHERYGLGRNEIDEELDLLGVGKEDTAIGPLGQGYANADNLVPGSSPNDQSEAAGHERSRSSDVGNRDLSVGDDLRINSEMDAQANHEERGNPGTGAAAKGEDEDASQYAQAGGDGDRQDILKDRGAASQSTRSAPLDQPDRRQGQRRRASERRS
ncbi:MAG TPA: hypothetical protein VLV87_09835 [Gammaproteobacteria bacterium]|nr:hypothetical protein [Gammaproteobacteria bacterium]